MDRKIEAPVVPSVLFCPPLLLSIIIFVICVAVGSELRRSKRPRIKEIEPVIPHFFILGRFRVFLYTPDTLHRLAARRSRVLVSLWRRSASLLFDDVYV